MADEREKYLKDRRKATDEANKAANKRMEDSQPTPTQEEVDRAKLGVSDLKELDDKEGDGTPEQEQRTLVPGHPPTYETRTAEATRGPGRPKKD